MHIAGWLVDYYYSKICHAYEIVTKCRFKFRPMNDDYGTLTRDISFKSHLQGFVKFTPFLIDRLANCHHV